MKLVVEVADAAELSAKDGAASCNAFVEVEFDGKHERERTATLPQPREQQVHVSGDSVARSPDEVVRGH